jgi:hypothetical protein
LLSKSPSAADQPYDSREIPGAITASTVSLTAQCPASNLTQLHHFLSAFLKLSGQRQGCDSLLNPIALYWY